MTGLFLRELIAIKRELQGIEKLMKPSLRINIDGHEVAKCSKCAMEHVIRTRTIKAEEVKICK